MLVTLCSDKGSPGTTTAALALASAWASPAVVIEADPYGGDLAIRLRTDKGATLPEAPTVLTLATTARTVGDHDVVSRYAQPLNPQVSLVPGHLVAEQIAGVRDWGALASNLARSDVPVMADIGRAHAGSPLLPLASAADVLVVVARADPGSVIRLRERLTRLIPAVAALRGASMRVCPLLVTPPKHGPGDVLDVTRLLRESATGALVSSVGFLAMDAASVQRLEAGENPRGRLARSPLLKTAHAFTRQLRDEQRVISSVGMAR